MGALTELSADQHQRVRHSSARRGPALCGILCVAVVLLLGGLANPVMAAELVMLEEDGCYWCERWDEEVGVVYHKTEEGKRAPLRRVDIHDKLPADLKFITKGGYTPTFVLVDNGRQLGRIRGYPGEDFFWGLLNQLLAKLPPQPDLSNKKTN